MLWPSVLVFKKLPKNVSLFEKNMEDNSVDIALSDMQKLSLDANETENQAQHTSVEIEDDDDAISEQFQATVLKRGSVKIDKRRPMSPRSRGQRRRFAAQDSFTKPNDNLMTSLTKFRVNQKNDSKNNNTIAVNADHSKVLQAAADRMKTQLPLSLEADIREEAYAIVQATAQAYKNLLGKKHRLTVEAFDYLSSM